MSDLQGPNNVNRAKTLNTQNPQQDGGCLPLILLMLLGSGLLALGVYLLAVLGRQPIG